LELTEKQQSRCFKNNHYGLHRGGNEGAAIGVSSVWSNFVYDNMCLAEKPERGAVPLVYSVSCFLLVLSAA
jgi:hypothetical protein